MIKIKFSLIYCLNIIGIIALILLINLLLKYCPAIIDFIIGAPYGEW